MTMLRPQTIPTPYSGNTDYYVSYQLVETPAADGPTTHATAVKVELLIAKNNPDWVIHVSAMETIVYTSAPPAPTQYYLTTISFSAIGQPGELPP